MKYLLLFLLLPFFAGAQTTDSERVETIFMGDTVTWTPLYYHTAGDTARTAAKFNSSRLLLNSNKLLFSSLDTVLPIFYSIYVIAPCDGCRLISLEGYYKDGVVYKMNGKKMFRGWLKRGRVIMSYWLK